MGYTHYWYREREIPVETYHKILFDFTKTAFKPYDLAVTVFLVIAKHYLGSKLLVHSDGEMPQWIDAMQICQNGFGYGLDFRLDSEE